MMFQELQGLMDWFFPKPLSIIFLDIDGVLIDYNKSIFIYRLLERCNHIYEQQKKLSKIITDPESKFLTSHYFSDKAVANLENMIIKISRTARVAIVISSGWRTWGTVDDLRNHMFASG